jgi:hypothetical protein
LAEINVAFVGCVSNIFNVADFGSVLETFYGNWTCAVNPNAVKPLKKYSHGGNYYYYFCTCHSEKSKRYENSKSTDNNIAIRFSVPFKSKDGKLWLSNVGYKKQSEAETLNHFLCLKNPGQHFNNFALTIDMFNENTKLAGKREKKILSAKMRELKSTKDTTSKVIDIIDDMNNAPDGTKETVVNNDDNNNDTGNSEDSGSVAMGGKDEDGGILGGTADNNVVDISDDDMEKLLIDPNKMVGKIQFDNRFEITKDYVHDEEEVKRLITLDVACHRREFCETSRPSLTAAGKNPNLSDKLNKLIFAAEGELQMTATNKNDKFSFIEFRGNNQDFIKKDVRGMLTWMPNQNPSSLFCKIKNLLSDHNLVDLKREQVFEILLLIGGTENQELHFDNTRIFGSARKKGDEGRDPNSKSSYNDLHEINRKLYNDEVMSDIGPASMIFDVTQRACGVQLGVLTNFLVVEDDMASVKHGVPGETFSLIEHGDKYSVIHIEGAGVVFPGDFPHFGVRNVDKSEKKIMKIMRTLFAAINKIKNKDPNNEEDCFKVFKNTKNLDELCRLFVKVKPTNSKFQLYDLDVVGAITKEVVDTGTYDYPKV